MSEPTLFAGDSGASRVGSSGMDPLSIFLTLMGSIITGGLQAHGTQQAAKSQRQTASEDLQFQREAGILGLMAQEEENRRRQTEAAFRAGKLEDVIKMFEGLGNSSEMRQMRGIARELQSQNGAADLRSAAMRELDINSESLNAMLAQSGVYGSGFGAQQQTQLAGNTLAQLARDISSQRSQNLMGAAGILGQLGQADMSRLGAIGSLYQDEAFGANAPYQTNQNLINEWRRRWNVTV